MGKSHWANSTLADKFWWKSRSREGLVRTATVIPDNERWLHEPKTATDLKNALSWAQANLPSD
ncbi:MAG: hypothetical protein QX196_05760 [Methylococcaceae bacterium]|jgi:hypothetical protein